MNRTWLTDANENRCSVEYWGTREKAQAALDSLKGCYGCYDCYDCYGCSGCSDCSRCYGCSDCSRCSGCYGCSDCSRCSGCSGCYGCSDCSGCYDCYGCSDCSDCYGLKNAAPTGGNFKAPEVPVIPEIHKRVYEAVTQPENSLDMSDWHTCETTHCRGGWIVTLAGEAGKKLEAFHGTLLAAQLIYDASDTSKKFNPCRFFDTDEAALADMKRLAEASHV